MIAVLPCNILRHHQWDGRPYQYCAWSLGDVTSWRKSAMPLRSGSAKPTRLKNGITCGARWPVASDDPVQHACEPMMLVQALGGCYNRAPI